MAYQATFKRYEIKYLLTQQQKQAIWEAIGPHMNLDRYGRTTIRNIYYDTDTLPVDPALFGKASLQRKTPYP